jgi:hypothetical protein
VWIRTGTGFSVDPDPAFYVTADPDQGSQVNADPGQTLPSLKDEVLYENILYVGNRS